MPLEEDGASRVVLRVDLEERFLRTRTRAIHRSDLGGKQADAGGVAPLAGLTIFEGRSEGRCRNVHW